MGGTRVSRATWASAVLGLVVAGAIATQTGWGVAERARGPLRATWSYRLTGNPATGSFRLYRGRSLHSLERIAEVPANLASGHSLSHDVKDAGDRLEHWVYQLRFADQDGGELVLGTVQWEPQINPNGVPITPDVSKVHAALPASLAFPTPALGSFRVETARIHRTALRTAPPAPPPKSGAIGI
jgi:hypothetical protein